MKLPRLTAESGTGPAQGIYAAAAPARRTAGTGVTTMANEVYKVNGFEKHLMVHKGRSSNCAGDEVPCWGVVDGGPAYTCCNQIDCVSSDVNAPYCWSDGPLGQGIPATAPLTAGAA
ncbi:hypothetical protein [Streptomyces pseudovenezuelae]|uniref:Uncharacterized protein n=1 Tax=Streptomyces pseudovenezuelae TaxID=67350 RepID=A0ABT6M0H3_9ACTN|nr:hypothetical protein [Streptomyces pseudovenezuelae]MDH6221554.1 hypothetical protein [Streptomyces pseudovenezuelae]